MLVYCCLILLRVVVAVCCCGYCVCCYCLVVSKLLFFLYLSILIAQTHIIQSVFLNNFVSFNRGTCCWCLLLLDGVGIWKEMDGPPDLVKGEKEV